MRKYGNIGYLMSRGRSLETALKNWKRFCQNIDDFCKSVEEYFASGNTDYKIPKLTKVDNLGEHKVTVLFAETTIECKFDYVGSGSLLRFGYVESNQNGTDKFVESSRIYVDTSGNFLDKKDGDTTSHGLQS